MPDGSEKPIGYASRTLTSAECNYSQLEKEGLSCIYGIKKFHDYLFGHHFESVTDHKPLLGLLKEDRPTSVQASARIKRWSLLLSSYEYTLTFRNTTAHANADALSRLLPPVTPATDKLEPEMVLLNEHLTEPPVSADDIRTWTARDPKLSRVLQYVQQGWPSVVDSDLERYVPKQLELSTYNGRLLWGNRVIVLPQGREAVLMELHEGHPGMTKIKALSRMYVWWPGINVTSAPYHPASNGLAEGAVQVVKNGLKKFRTGSVNTRLAKLLLTYRVTPQSTTGVSSVELLIRRRPRTQLDLLHPNTPARVKNKQMEQKLRNDRKAKRWVFSVGEPIFTINFGTGRRWLPEDIIERARPVSFRVRLEDGRFRRCHQDQLRHREVQEDTPDTSDSGVDDSNLSPIPTPVTGGYVTPPVADTDSPEMVSPSGNVQIRVPIDNSQHEQSNVQPNVQLNIQSTNQSNNQPVPRYPRRNCKPLQVYDPGTK